MSISTLGLPAFAEMVGKNLTASIEEAIYDELRPITDRIARSAAKRIANSVKGFASYQMNYKDYEPQIILQFNSEDIKL